MSGTLGSWARRRLLALLINSSLLTVTVLGAALSSDAGDWRPLGLLVALAVFAVASDLLSTRLRHGPTPSSDETSWSFTSSAPFILAAVFLGAAPALAIGFTSLCVVTVAERTPWRDVIANAANYGAYLVVAALLAELAISSWDLPPEDAAFLVVVIGVYALGVVVSFLVNATYGALAYGESVRWMARNEWRIQLSVEAPIMLMTGLTAQVYGAAGLAALVLLAALQLIFVSLGRELHRSYERAAALRQRGDELVNVHADLARHTERISELSASRSHLVGQILSAEESERRRLAEALHDEAMQNLLTARQDLAASPEDPILDRARIAVDATIDQLRDAIFELHPAVLEQVGLAAAVQTVADRAARRGGFEVCVIVAPEASGQHDGLLFTIARELLANSAEHAHASRVAVCVQSLDESVLIEVTDDGCGFERSTLGSALAEGHIGLASTAERIEALGGSFDVDSRPNRGTTVRAIIPRPTRATAAAQRPRNRLPEVTG